MKRIVANGREVIVAEPKGGRRPHFERPQRSGPLPQIAAPTDAVVYVTRPCIGRHAVNCDNGIGCTGHLVRVLILRGKL